MIKKKKSFHNQYRDLSRLHFQLWHGAKLRVNLERAVKIDQIRKEGLIWNTGVGIERHLHWDNI